jgi:16S rRNA pseudouridine516 synthase
MSKVHGEAIVRLDKLLSSLGYGSRKNILSMAKKGYIVLDSSSIHDASHKVNITSDMRDRLYIKGEKLDPMPGMVLMMNKPIGATCSHKEVGKLVYDFLPDRWRHRTPVMSTIGRLDKDTSGLLLITDDGELLHKIIGPKNHVKKVYLVDVAAPLTKNAVDIFASGALMLRGDIKPLASAELKIIGSKRALITITEGRYHQVRRMFAAIGNRVVRLHRTQIGALKLPDTLEQSSWKLLLTSDVTLVFD